MTKRKNKKPTVLCVAPFNNPHIIPFYDNVAQSNDLDVTLVSLRAISPERLSLGWQEMEPNNGYLQPWRSFADRMNYYRRLLTSDLVVFPGFFHSRTLPLHHLFRRITFRPSILWSEPLLNHPRSINEKRLKRLMRRIVLMPFNTASYHFFAMGAGAEIDYRSLGMTKWDYRQFHFSVRPISSDVKPVNFGANGVRRIVYCGALEHRKGVDLLIAALHQITEIPFRLTILGDGSARSELERQVSDLGLDDRVEFVGAIKNEESYQHLVSNDLLVLPSRFDGWGAVVNEAMECSLAVISSDQVGARQPLIKNGLNGFIFQSESVSDLKDKIVAAIESPKKLEKMKMASKERIKLFTAAAAAEKFADFCQKIFLRKPYASESDTLKSV